MVFTIPQKMVLTKYVVKKTSAEDVRLSIKRLNKIKLSKTSNVIFEKTLFSFCLSTRRHER